MNNFRPKDRADPLRTQPGNVARRATNIPSVKCWYGCDAALTREDLESHNRTCPNRIYQCSRQGCEFKGNSTAYVNHILQAHSEDIITIFDEKEHKKRFTKSGTVEGYYKQSGKDNPITGTYKINQGKIVIHTTDETGTTTLKGEIDLESMHAELVKNRSHESTVYYRGKINKDVTEMNGHWSYGDYPIDEFKLIFQ